jgi:hypothetical protein
MSSAAYPALQYFSTLSHKRHDLWKKKSYWIQNVSVDFLYNSEIFLTLKRTQLCIIKNEYWLHVKCPLYLSDFNWNWIFSTDFLKIFQCQISWKSVVGTEFFQTGGQTNGQTYRHGLTVAFRIFANAPNNVWKNGASEVKTVTGCTMEDRVSLSGRGKESFIRQHVYTGSWVISNFRRNEY